MSGRHVIEAYSIDPTMLRRDDQYHSPWQITVSRQARAAKQAPRTENQATPFK